ncbi:DNA-directed RNA polymerase subunit delta [Mycoplasma nasistruthionis]|uniref:HTH HARE-type domain-containing protein n=1 Tax=Mycoplasma nasistruthionis TaxID=353852 RepID=A0A4Y6I5A3_9MOLU|nr:hypothetical protein [Mycoplasma nasistruthionis]QDF64786.1 hypothetical protein FIV53_00435 [Mycoplasma nasistruthionis]
MENKVVRTMLEIAIEVVNSNTQREYDFHEIFNVVESELEQVWREKFTKNGELYEKVRETKMGELHRLLTVDKRFEYAGNGKWEGKNY